MTMFVVSTDPFLRSGEPLSGTEVVVSRSEVVDAAGELVCSASVACEAARNIPELNAAQNVIVDAPRSIAAIKLREPHTRADIAEIMTLHDAMDSARSILNSRVF